MQPIKKILIVEDDLGLTLALYRALSHTYKVITAKSALSGLNKAQALFPDLIILDLNLPDLSGLTVTKKLRQIGVHAPILVLSGEAGLISKVDLLDNGADDYVTKPFSLAELRARIRVLLRKRYYPKRKPLVFGGLMLNPNLRQASVDESTVYLRRKEYLLLECLMSNPGVAVSRDYLKEYAWGQDKIVKNNSIDVHIKMLRAKLEPLGGPDLIKTVQGVGYTFKAG
jgi:DNA-binding response OmpR family regulator